MSDRMARRRDALRKILKDEGQGADAVLIASAANVTYLTGFTGDSSVVFLTQDRTVVVSDGRYAEQLERECADVEHSIRPVGKTLIDGMVEAATMLGARKVAFEAAHFTVHQHLALVERVPNAAWRSMVLWVERLRIVKDALELDAIREAIGFAERAFARVCDSLRTDRSRTEKQVADELEFELRRCGATAAAFPPIVAAGANAALAHARPTATTSLENADLVLIDWGAAGQLYKSDLTRVLRLGPSDRFDTIYQAVLDAQQRAIEAVRPGRTSREIDTVARTSLEEAGLAKHFTHALGHGIGLELHEIPALGREPDVTLEPGMIFTVEPGVYLPGWGGIRIEDMVLVTEDGAEVLTSVPRAAAL